MDSKTFWNLVEQTKLKLLADHESRKKLYAETKDKDAFEGQPADGSGLFTITVEDVLEKNQFGGQVTCLPYRLAAQRIIEKRHRVATAEEIKADDKASRGRVKDDAEKERSLAALRAGTAEKPNISVYVDGQKAKSKAENGSAKEQES